MKTSTFLFLVAPFILAGPAPTQMPKHTKVILVGKNVHMLGVGAGGNLAVCAGKDGIVVVDSEYARLTGKVKAAIAAISDQPVKYLINTHWHFDHVGGNESFAKAGSLIVAHENVRKRMAVDQVIGLAGRKVPASPEMALPIFTYTRAITLHFNGDEIAVVHIPLAHTDGDSIVHFRKANVLHTGDIFFNGGYPFIDIKAGGNIDGMIAAVEAILKMCDDKTRIIPGHGPVATRADLEKYGSMLREFRAAIFREIEAGKDLEAILAARTTAALDRQWGRAFFPPGRFTRIVFHSLKNK